MSIFTIREFKAIKIANAYEAQNLKIAAYFIICCFFTFGFSHLYFKLFQLFDETGI